MGIVPQELDAEVERESRVDRVMAVGFDFQIRDRAGVVELVEGVPGHLIVAACAVHEVDVVDGTDAGGGHGWCFLPLWGGCVMMVLHVSMECKPMFRMDIEIFEYRVDCLTHFRRCQQGAGAG